MTDPNRLLADYARSNLDEIREDYAHSAARIRELNVDFEDPDDLVTHFAVPYCIDRHRYEALCADASLVFDALNRVVVAYRTDPQVRAFFPHLEQFERFLTLPVLPDPAIAIARYDLVESRSGEFKIVEPNTCCPGGTIWASMFNEIFREGNTYRFLREHITEVPQRIHNGDTIYDFLTEQHARHFGPRDRYAFAIADTRTAPMEAELHELRDGARQRGHNAEKCQIQDFKRKSDGLYLKDLRIDIVYQFLDVLYKDNMAQIAASYDEIADYLEAIRRREVLAVQPFPPIFLSEDKSILALLTDEAFKDHFTQDEHAAIAGLVPETYRLAEGKVRFEGDTVDLRHLLLERKNDFLVKAQMESMGRDIVIGREVSDDRWRAHLDTAIGGLHVAQRFIEETPMELHAPGEAPGPIVPLHYTLALFILGGEPVGMLNRVSPDLVTNVARGGAAGEVIVYE
jgi:hypothetical protein